ncbi:MAG: endonuclease III [Bacillota bacterium]|nr:endonuclease III [Bacillota bacterium]
MRSRDTKRLKRILARLEQAYPGARCALVHANPFQLLIATMLSAQCTDECVNRVSGPLFARYPGPEDFLKLSEEELAGLIRECGLNRTKARHIHAVCRALVEEHGGQVPASVEALTALPGVGRKTAGVVLANAFAGPYLPVDTHVFRVAHRLGLASGKTPDQVSDELEALVPPDLRLRAHHQLIAHGRQVCTARRPRCAACPLAPDCPSRDIFSPSQA